MKDLLNIAKKVFGQEALPDQPISKGDMTGFGVASALLAMGLVSFSLKRMAGSVG